MKEALPQKIYELPGGKWSDLALWLIIWVVGIGFHRSLKSFGIDLIHGFEISAAYFAILSVLLLVSLKTVFSYLVHHARMKTFLFVLGTIALALCSHYIAHMFLTRPDALIATHPGVEFLQMDVRYMVSKSFEILFQQIMIIWLILILKRMDFSLVRIMYVFAALFGVTHLLLIFILSPAFTVFFLFFAMISAVAFPYIIVYVKDGFVYSYLLHWLFYIVAGLFFWSGVV